MFLSWLKKRRRRRILATPFPDHWHACLVDNMALFQFLSPSEQARLQDKSQIFITEKTWEGCRGLTMTEEIQVIIAAQACLLVLELADNYFDNVQTILVYPTAFVAPREQPLGEGTVLEEKAELLGEAHYRGPVLLAWDEVLAAARQPGHGDNLVFHEFAHQLDMQDGLLNGTPLLPSRQLARRWQQVMTAEFNRLRRQAERGTYSDLDDYGATDEAEFFAVVTESFFDQPDVLQRRHPQLYDLLRDFYGQDPVQRVPS